MKNYDEFIKRLEQYEKSIDELNAASFVDSDQLTKQCNMHRERMLYFVRTRIVEEDE